MQSFKNMSGKNYSVNMTMGLRNVIKAKLDIDVLELADNDFELLQTIGNDMPLMGELILVAFVPDAYDDQDKMAAFFDQVDGTTLEAAFKALLEAVADFFPKSKGDALRTILGKMFELEEAATKQITEQLAKLPIGILASELTNSLGSSPEESEYTQTVTA